MARLFKRAVSLTLLKPLDGQFFKFGLVSTLITGLRVVFDIEKHLGKDPNTCTVKIYNLAERTRGEVQEKPVHVILKGGYEDRLETLFQGDVTWADSRKDGGDWETTLTLGDGQRAFQHAKVSRSYRSGVTVDTVLREVAKTMGLRVNLTPAARALLSRQYVGGFVPHGPSRNELTRILAPLDIEWSIQDGELQLLRPSDFRVDLPIDVSQDSGMTGSPEFGAPEKKGGNPLLTVTTLLNARIAPGGRIRVRARNVNGVFRVERATYNGDSYQDDWLTTAEARAL